MNEKQELYEKFNIRDDRQLPEISMRFDPVAKVILLKNQKTYVRSYVMIKFLLLMNFIEYVLYKF